MVGAPLISRIFIFSEHSFSGTGGVHHDAVKKFPKCAGKSGRCHVGDDPVCNAHPLHVLRQDLRPGRVDLIADQKSLLSHFSGQMSAFSPRCSAEIQDLCGDLIHRVDVVQRFCLKREHLTGGFQHFFPMRLLFSHQGLWTSTFSIYTFIFSFKVVVKL